MPTERVDGGWPAAHLMREGFWRRQPEESEMGPRHGDRRGQPGRRPRWRGWHGTEGRVDSHPLAGPRELPANGRNELSWAGFP